MITITESQVHFGVWSDKPELKEGWKWLERADNFLMAEAPDGKRYFAGKKVFSEAVKFADGSHGVNIQKTIPIPVK